MMSKFLIISAFFLLPFVIITSISAQYELPKYELPSDYIITYELDEPDESEQQKEKTKLYRTLRILLLVVIVGVVIVVVGALIWGFVLTSELEKAISNN
jgi:hypothetical protein